MKYFDRLSITVFIYNLRRRRPSRVCQRTHPAPVRFYPRCHLRYGLVSPIQGAPNSVTTSLSCRLSLRMLKLKTVHAFCFDFDLSGTLFFSRREECRLGFADRDVGKRTEEPWTNLPEANLNNACVGPVGVRRRDAPNTRDCRSFR